MKALKSVWTWMLWEPWHLELLFAFTLPPNTFGNFVAAVQAAVNDNCNIISISWGQTETYWTATAQNALNAVFQDAASKGITVFCAAGDNGASDGKPGLNVDFPGSSPYSVCCGGTKILTSGGVITSETVWGTSTTYVQQCRHVQCYIEGHQL